MSVRSGILLIDKPSGMTSHDVVAKLRKKLNVKSIGHCGTLDPLATGLMVMLIGQATKLSDHLLKAQKSYEVLVELGLETDSWDVDGKVLNEESVDLDQEQLKNVALSISGEGEYPVPVFSAIKIKGKKLYEYARAEEEIVVPSRKMNFFDVKVLEVKPSSLRAELSCAKGGYIRSWAHVLGQKMDTWGTVKELRRTASVPYKVTEAIMLDEVLPDYWKSRSFTPLNQCLSDWKTFTVSGRDEVLMGNGQIPNSLKQRLNFDQKEVNKQSLAKGVKVVGAASQLIALLDLKPCKRARISRIFV